MTEPQPTSRACCAKRSRPSSRRPNWPARLEGALQSITEMAADELEAWELSAMRDPRNWVRPAAALAAGGAAATALVVLRGQTSSAAAPPRSVAGVRKAAGRTLEDLERETRRLLGDAEPPEQAPAQLGSRSRMATCYRHPSRETGGLLLELRAADLPRLHDEHPGRHALPRVRPPAHGGQAPARRRRRSRGSPTR